MRGREKLISFFMGLIITAGWVTSAAAQDNERKLYTPLGSRIPRWEEAPSPAELNAGKVLREFAGCVAKKKKFETAELLKTLPDSAGEIKVINAIVGGYSICLRGASQMRLKASLFRGAIAEAVFKSTIPAAENATRQPMLMTFTEFEGALKSADRDGVDKDDESVHAAWWMSYCSVHENPAGVVRILYSEPDTADEMNAIRNLRPTMTGCLYRNQSADFNRLGLRAALSNALCRMRFKLDDRI